MDIVTPSDIMNGNAGPRTSWLVAFFTGYTLVKRGKHSPFQVFVLAMAWKVWAAVLMWWTGVAVLMSGVTFPGSWNTMPIRPGLTAWIVITVFHVALIYIVMGVSYMRLCILCDFNKGGVFGPCMAVAQRIPNMDLLWLYLAPFAPFVWTLILLFAVAA